MSGGLDGLADGITQLQQIELIQSERPEPTRGNGRAVAVVAQGRQVVPVSALLRLSPSNLATLIHTITSHATTRVHRKAAE